MNVGGGRVEAGGVEATGAYIKDASCCVLGWTEAWLPSTILVGGCYGAGHGLNGGQGGDVWVLTDDKHMSKEITRFLLSHGMDGGTMPGG